MPLIVMLYFYLRHLRRAYGISERADERHVALTEDGFNLAVSRYLPHETGRVSTPVLFVHGLGANRLNFDADDDVSLARYLAERGYDCWLLDLRGCGESVATGLKWNWTFDDYMLRDIPAALNLIRRETGHSKVHWVGHSMGGMLLYAYLLRMGAQNIQSGVTLGSPVRFSPRADRFHRVVAFERIVRMLPQLPIAGMSRLVTPLIGQFNPEFVRRQMNVKNVDWNVIRKAFYNTTSHLAPGVLLQFFSWMRNDDFLSADGAYSYRDHLSEIETPLFVVAGRGDKLVPVCDVREAYDCVGSSVKQYLELCSDDGFHEDYGHVDIIFGRRSRDEVFPRICGWLDGFHAASR
jgi:pimeloyl-ACP methyl ester carboxylesterase